MENKPNSQSSNVGCGCFSIPFSVGGVLAFIVSWKLFHLFWWAALASFFGWCYVAYALYYYLPQIRLMLG